MLKHYTSNGQNHEKDKVMQDGSHVNITGLYINNHRRLKETSEHFHETVSDKFLLQYNVAARKDIKNSS